MMHATLDIGSNTVRMLIGECIEGRLHPFAYERQITRLAGDYSIASGLSTAAMNRTLSALESFNLQLQQNNIPCLRAVGTAALRRAVNQHDFITQVEQQTGLIIEVIDGAEEARLTAAGVLSVIVPRPKNALIFDIGGGSTELILIANGHIMAQESYPLGVVRLSEECCASKQRQQLIDSALAGFCTMFRQKKHSFPSLELIGTAGTMTTLAAMEMGMARYDAVKINNHRLSVQWMLDMYHLLEAMTVVDREKVPGMEQGRGDLILPGLQLALSIADMFGISDIKVSDAGLLEGVFLAACRD